MKEIKKPALQGDTGIQGDTGAAGLQGDTGIQGDTGDQGDTGSSADAIESATIVVAASNSVDTSRADYVCDGTDDEVEINQAVDDLSSTGGTVKLLEGTYEISDTIVLDYDYINIVGNGWGTILNNDSDGVMFFRIDETYCSVKDLKISGSGSYDATGQEAIEVNNYTGDHFTLDNVWIYGSARRGIWIEDGCDYIRIIDCYFSNCQDDAIFAEGNYTLIRGCNFFGSGGCSIYLKGERIRVLDNQFVGGVRCPYNFPYYSFGVYRRKKSF